MTKGTDFNLPALKAGAAIDLADYAGRPLLVANTASLCGFTPQYAGLQQLWTEYGPKGLGVVAVPSPDFGGQEHKDPAKTAELCDARFRLTFPVAAAAHVAGRDPIPLFRWLAEQAGPAGRPRWNFYKYLIGRDGSLLAWFTPLTAPTSRKLRAAVERALAP